MTDFVPGRSPAPRTSEQAPRQEEAADLRGEGGWLDPENAQMAQWIASIASGNSGSLGLLYDATLGRCYGLALRIVRDANAAEDVCEDVYLQVWRDAARFEPARGNALAWLMMICRSRALDHLRRRRMEEVRDDVQALLACEEKQDPFDLVQALNAKSRLGEALSRLSPAQRQVIGLAFYRGMTQQEIADHLRMSPGTVKTNTRRALVALRAAIGPGVG